VVAQVQRVEPRRQQRRVEDADGDAGAPQRLHHGGEREAHVDVVDHHAHRHAARHGARERVDELRADALAVEDVRGEADRDARALDRLEHRRIGFPAVDQRLDRVAGQQRPADHLADQPRERRELGARIAAAELGCGAVLHERAAHPRGAPLDAVHADQHVEHRPDGGQQPDEQEPQRRRARLALVDDGMARRE
jgi:hypothetical protein